MKHGPELSFDDDGRPVLITRAALPFEEEHRARVRRYLTLMFWRIPALILAAVAYGIWENGLISLAIILVSVPLRVSAALSSNHHRKRFACVAGAGHSSSTAAFSSAPSMIAKPRKKANSRNAIGVASAP